MMKVTIFFRWAALAVIIIASAAETCGREVQQQHLYMFGFAASFKDSTVYVTDIQDVQGAWVDTKTHFLLDRDSYSHQLRRYLEDNRQELSRVCLVVFAPSKSKAEKKMAKLLKKYNGKKAIPYDIRRLTEAEFRFDAVERTQQE